MKEIIYRELDEITLLEDNPRKISVEQMEKLKESIDKNPDYFECRPVILSDRTGELVVIAGNQRVKAATAIGLKAVPTILLSGLTEEREKEIIIRDNVNNGEWDEELLAEWDAALLDDWGVDISALSEENFSQVGEENREAKEDEFDEGKDAIPALVSFGDIWKLGEHRLMCGDSTDAGSVALLMDGEKADMVFTDPPYGMKKESDGVLNDNLNFDDLLEFNKKWITLTFENLTDVGSWYCWGIDEPLMDIYSHILKPMAKRNEVTFRNLITWDKGSGQGQMSNLLRSYAIADEKCLFVMKGVQGFNTNTDNYFQGWDSIRLYLEGEAKKVGLNNSKLKEICGVGMYAHWFTTSQFQFITENHYKELQDYYREYGAFKREYGALKREYYSTRAYFDNEHDNMNNVWHFNRTSQEERGLTGGHATPKPIALCSRGIKSSSREGEIVLDVFGGSGSTMMACEQLDRKCYMMELDPHYCDVIIARWEKLTGKKAEKVS